MPVEARMNPSHSELLERLLDAEVARAAGAVADAREKVESAVTTIAPTIERARDELATFERILGWREFADLSAKGRALVDRVVAWGSGGAGLFREQ